tara:strand:+ start:479 stop:2782 length:2304 start_codon:yes stop_codon:yes gene_type:complete
MIRYHPTRPSPEQTGSIVSSTHKEQWMSIFFGTEQDSTRVEIEPDVFLRHAVCLGASGSGKTVACKVLCEEFLLKKTPIIAIDPQGDIASMILPGDPEEIASKGLSKETATQFHEQVEVVIWTPASRAGIPLSLDPLKLDRLPKRKEARVRLLSALAANFTALLGYQLDSNDGQFITAYLDLVLQYIVEQNIEVDDLSGFAAFLDDLPEALAERTNRVIQLKKRQEVSRKIEVLGIGAKRLLFQMGTPLDIDVLLGRDSDDDTTRLSVIYLNTLHSQEEKEFFVSQLAQSLYDWMLNHPSSTPQAVFYIDEIAPYIPPVRKPACKDVLKLLFKQARKYGITCLIASQNPGDVDYTALSQFSTWALGRMMLKQDIKKIEKILRSLSPADVEQIIEALPSLDPGQFLLVSPDTYERVVDFKVRWLYTKHETLEEEQIEDLIPDALRERFSQPLATKRPAPVEPEVQPTQAEVAPTEEPDEELDDTEEDIPEAEVPKSNGELLLEYIDAHPGAYTVKELTHELSMSENLVRKALKQDDVAKLMSSAKVSRSHYYWLSKHRFEPTVGLRRPILTAGWRADRNQAIRLAERECDGLLGAFSFGFLRTETAEGPKEGYLLLWRVVLTFQKPSHLLLKLVSSPEVKELHLYFHAKTGHLLVLQSKQIEFISTEGKKPSERLQQLRPDKLEDLAHFAEFFPKTPADLSLQQKTLTSLKSPAGIESACKKLFEGAIQDTRLVAFPYWHFDIVGSKNKRRPFKVDGLMGIPFDEPRR